MLLNSFLPKTNSVPHALRVQGFLFLLTSSVAGCAQSTAPPAVPAPKVAPVSQSDPALGGVPDLPPGIKPEDVARYVIERGRKQREQAERPGNDAAFEQMMEISLRNGAFGNMKSAARQQIAASPRDAMGPYYLGTALFYDGDFTGAQAAWKQAKQLDPTVEARLAPFEARLKRIYNKFPGLQLDAVRMVDSDNSAQRMANWKLAKSLLDAKKYDALEAEAQKLQAQKATGLDGHAPIESFMEGIWFQGERGDGQNERDAFAGTKKRLDAWVTARPKSVWPRIAQIANETHWASAERGGAYANEVTPEQWAGMHVHLKAGGEIVKRLPPNALKVPIACDVVLRWAHFSDMPEPEIRTLWARFDREYPDSLEIASAWGFHLLPQWSGEPGEWENFATTWANRKPGAEGDIRYAQFAIKMRDFFRKDEIWKKSTIGWPRVKRGLQAILKQHPQSVGIGSALVLLALENQDTAAAQQALLSAVKGSANRVFFESPKEFADLRLKLLDPAGA